MALLERVATLLRANLDDLVERAEDPEKSMKQVIRDIENQLLQVKTQMAITVADLHLLERKRDENGEKGSEMVRKAELCVARGEDQLARAALDRSLQCREIAGNFDQQISDQKVQSENLQAALSSLQAKLVEAQSMTELLAARRRRARAISRAAEAQSFDSASTLKRMEEGALEHAGIAKRPETPVNSGREAEIDRLLADLKSRART